MKRNSIQKQVATSSFTLPVASVIATVLWFANGDFSLYNILGWAVCGITGYVWMETNNSNALLRIRTRLTSSSFLILTGCMPFLHKLQDSSWIPLCILLSYYLLFRSYQKPYAVTDIFHAFFFLGLGSMIFPHLILFVLFYFWYMVVFLRSLSPRTLSAAIIGVMLPYWLLFGYNLIFDIPQTYFIEHFSQLLRFYHISLSAYENIDITKRLSFIFIFIQAVIACIHYVRNSFNDKIRIRMLFYIILIQEFLTATFIILQPAHFDFLFGLLVMNSAPLIAHFFALTDKRLTNIWFIITLLTLAIIATFNTWIL